MELSEEAKKKLEQLLNDEKFVNFINSLVLDDKKELEVYDINIQVTISKTNN